MPLIMQTPNNFALAPLVYRPQATPLADMVTFSALILFSARAKIQNSTLENAQSVDSIFTNISGDGVLLIPGS